MSIEEDNSLEVSALARKMKTLINTLHTLDPMQRQILNTQIDLALELAGKRKPEQADIAEKEGPAFPEGWRYADKFAPTLSKKTQERTRYVIEFLRTLGVENGRVYYGGDHMGFKYKEHYVELDINSRYANGRIFVRFSPSDMPLERFTTFYYEHPDRRIELKDINNIYDRGQVISAIKELLEKI